MVLIGIDPHKATHTTVAVDTEETALGELTMKADCHQVERLLKWAIDFPERRWAIESANGLGFLLAQQLVAAGEDVVDVPPTLAARVRVLGSGKTQKNDPNDALSTAIAALRAKRLRSVVAENHGGVLRLLADHHHDLGSLRTQAVCRLHALVRCLIPGGTQLRLSAARAARCPAQCAADQCGRRRAKAHGPWSSWLTSDASTPRSPRPRPASSPPWRPRARV